MSKRRTKQRTKAVERHPSFDFLDACWTLQVLRGDDEEEIRDYVDVLSSDDLRDLIIFLEHIEAEQNGVGKAWRLLRDYELQEFLERADAERDAKRHADAALRRAGFKLIYGDKD